ncbi:phosphotransferase family protein [Streptomyces sp. VRA16 Mangrove soil]|uniref:phosphotransferase family protein n=1 Tax=Streptomyces sp. VRA16 Mangrove soil TaxID=2817434 RepID=UPI001A9F4696|nr:aminoglycoside phosphotransferase family protein [Streptomyces sp. VRA16 Mangrove soil]MBO1335511.1 aminoglycoside phosphotransferase family protein [Streptomyces sp. VRA16 Mangrove soil]
MQEPPDEDRVRRLLKTILPNGVTELRPVEGTAATWWVGSKHVLRLAPDAPAARGLRREVRLRDLVRPYVPVAVAACVTAGEWAPGLAYTLDTRLPGASAETRDVTAGGEEDLAGLLTGLHAVPVARVAPLGVPKAPPRSLDQLRRDAGGVVQRLDEDGEFEAVRLKQLTAQAVAQLGPQPDAVLVHHDLKGEHLIVSADGRVRGVLDWAAAVVGDPAEDIAGLAVAVGARAAVRSATLAGYGARVCLRGLWLARCDALLRLAARLHGDEGRPAAVLRVQLERAWEPILLELVSDG